MCMYIAWIYALQKALRQEPPSLVMAKEGSGFIPIKVPQAAKLPHKISPLSTLYFDAVLKKTKEGFGIVIKSTQGCILVDEASHTMDVLSVIPESVETVKVGDRLVKINDQDVNDWTISSIIELIGDERIPVEETARFTFCRKHQLTVRPKPDRLSSERDHTSPSSARSPMSSPLVTPREVSVYFIYTCILFGLWNCDTYLTTRQSLVPMNYLHSIIF